MRDSQKSLIDNWSLEQAGLLLDSNTDIHYNTISEAGFVNSLGGLSNYINAVLLYDETNYLANGFEKEWNRFNWFDKQNKSIITPINPGVLNIDWHNEASYSDQGIKNYLVSSEQFKTDLFVSPERATKIIEYGSFHRESTLSVTFKKIDEKINTEKNSLWFEQAKVGVERNFQFPSLTQYVLSQAANSNELLTVITQLKRSGKVQSVRNKIDEIAASTNKLSKYQKDVEALIKKSFGDPGKSDKPYALKFGVLFLTITRSFNLDFFKRKQHLLFLKDIIACRAEANRLNKDIKRIFGRELAN